MPLVNYLPRAPNTPEVSTLHPPHMLRNLPLAKGSVHLHMKYSSPATDGTRGAPHGASILEACSPTTGVTTANRLPDHLL